MAYHAQPSTGRYLESRFQAVSFVVTHEAKAEKEFTCDICLKILDTPESTPCDHVFCKVCIRNWLVSMAKTCPACRCNITPDELRPARIVQSLLNKKYLRCMYAENGCRSVLLYSDVLEHEACCPFSSSRTDEVSRLQQLRDDAVKDRMRIADELVRVQVERDNLARQLRQGGLQEVRPWDGLNSFADRPANTGPAATGGMAIGRGANPFSALGDSSFAVPVSNGNFSDYLNDTNEGYSSAFGGSGAATPSIYSPPCTATGAPNSSSLYPQPPSSLPPPAMPLSQTQTPTMGQQSNPFGGSASTLGPVLAMGAKKKETTIESQGAPTIREFADTARCIKVPVRYAARLPARAAVMEIEAKENKTNKVFHWRFIQGTDFGMPSVSGEQCWVLMFMYNDGDAKKIADVFKKVLAKMETDRKLDKDSAMFLLDKNVTKAIIGEKGRVHTTICSETKMKFEIVTGTVGNMGQWGIYRSKGGKEYNLVKIGDDEVRKPADYARVLEKLIEAYDPYGMKTITITAGPGGMKEMPVGKITPEDLKIWASIVPKEGEKSNFKETFDKIVEGHGRIHKFFPSSTGKASGMVEMSSIGAAIALLHLSKDNILKWKKDKLHLSVEFRVNQHSDLQASMMARLEEGADIEEVIEEAEGRKIMVEVGAARRYHQKHYQLSGYGGPPTSMGYSPDDE